MSATPRPAPPPLGDLLAEALVRRRRGGDAALLRDTISLLSRERGGGHVCVALAQWQARAPAEGGATFPALAAWRGELRASGLAGDGSDAPHLPLVLDTADRLYLRRDFVAERRIAQRVYAAVGTPPVVSAEALARAFAAVGLAASRGAVDWQLAAIAASVRTRFTVITGGPGTGKTTTVARLLAVHAQLRPGARVALCAPTGKASARLGEALARQAAVLPALAQLAPSIESTTLHRLLRYLAIDDRFRAGPDAPLAHDLVVVDEASMVDPSVLAALCEALRADASLVLVGDRDQLPAVAAGQVLADLCAAAAPERGVGTDLAAFVQAATGMSLPAQSGAAAIANHVIALRDNFRFADQPGIGAFAQALAARDATRARHALAAGHADLQRAADAEAGLAAVAEPLLAAALANDPAQALAHLRRARVLTATHHGPAGTAAWNRRIEAWLATRGVRVDETWYVGRPVLVTANDYQNRVWNGDVGVVAREADGRIVVCFPNEKSDREGVLHRVPALRLPAHETAWAMTVHKAQGSEFDEVLLAMPDQPGPAWQAPLLYTGITRARKRAILLADDALLAPALGNWPQRSSGLADALAR